MMHQVINCYASANAATDPYFANTVLLLGFEGADGAIVTSDESLAAHAAQAFAGNAQIDTGQFKFGSSSLLLDGTDDAIGFDDSNDWTFPGQFTVEAWIRFNAISGFQTIISQWDSNNADRGWLFDYSTAGSELRFLISTNGTNEIITSGAWSPSTGTWYHVVADRDASDKVRIYAGGAMVGSSTVAGSTSNEPEGIRVGCMWNGANAQFLNGWIDEVRITKGVARYASDGGYTVPTTAFPRS